MRDKSVESEGRAAILKFPKLTITKFQGATLTGFYFVSNVNVKVFLFNLSKFLFTIYFRCYGPVNKL